MSPFIALLVLTSAGAPTPAVVTAAVQQDTLTVKEAEPGLKAKATVPSDKAIRTAIAKVPGGTIREAELEKEHGRLVYSFDIRDPKKSGVEEVLVDARTGKVVSAKHESAASEAREQAGEAKPAVKHDSTMMKHDSTK